MSADNGIYIAEFPKADGQVEFRVTEAGAIDNCELSFLGDDARRPILEDAYRVLYFGDAKVFTNEDEAGLYALKLSKDNWTEYGVCQLTFDRPLSDMSQEEAEKIIRD